MFDGEDPLSPGAFESRLRRHVLDAWFPRCRDREHGGFLCDFDHAWRPTGPHDKLLEFQTRQTLLAAEASRAYPDDPILREAARAGFDCLRDTLWDRDCGGWFRRTDRAGKPLEGATKHVHGVIYGISACAAVHLATGAEDALELAREAFRWMDARAHDETHGGYFGFLSRGGDVIRDPEHHPWGVDFDTLEVPLGFKDSNVHTDLLEALTLLLRTWPDPLVRSRLEELVDLFDERLVTHYGALPDFFAPDWQPVAHLERLGYVVQGSHRLAAAGDLVGRRTSRQTARRMLGHALCVGWDPRAGAFHYATPSTPPFELEDQSLVVKKKVWWVQFEALRALLALDDGSPESASYADRFACLWSYVRRHLLDERHGGVHEVADRRPAWRQRLRRGPRSAKGRDWKDGSHEGRTLLFCVQELARRRARGEGANVTASA